MRRGSRAETISEILRISKRDEIRISQAAPVETAAECGGAAAQKNHRVFLILNQAEK